MKSCIHAVVLKQGSDSDANVHAKIMSENKTMSVKNVHVFRPRLPEGATFYRRKYLQHVDVFLLQQNGTHEL